MINVFNTQIFFEFFASSAYIQMNWKNRLRNDIHMAWLYAIYRKNFKIDGFYIIILNTSISTHYF